MRSTTLAKATTFVIAAGLALGATPGVARSATRGTASAPVATVTIDWNDLRQTIDGFGATEGADEGFSPLLQAWPEPERTQILDLAFSQERGIGLTVLRSQVPPGLEPSPGVWNYDDPAQVWLMKEALARGPVKLMASVWSPPPWMKTHPNIVGGELAPSHYQDFADFLSHYATEYARANGVDIHALSMANEPDNTFAPGEPGWATCAWTSAQIATFLGGYLSPTFGNRPIDRSDPRHPFATKIIAPETSDWSAAEPFLSATFADPNPNGSFRIDLVAAHLYGGTPAQPLQSAQNRGKKVWQTEASLRHDVWTMDGALAWAKDIHDGLTGAQVSAWLWWALVHWHDNQSLMAFDYDSGHACGGNGDCAAGQTCDMGTCRGYDGRSFSVSKTLWALGNFSKFVRPGYVRLGTAAVNATSLDVSAYKNPADGRLVVVVVNRNTGARSLRFDPVGFSARSVTPYVTSATQDLEAQSPAFFDGVLTVPAKSVVTFVSRPLDLGRFDAWSNAPGAKALAGDLDGDGRSDVALVGGQGWNTVPAAFSNGDGTFRVTNPWRGDFADLAARPGVRTFVGDFDGDGRADLALVNGAAAPFPTLPVAFSNGDGSFDVSLPFAPDFAGWATVPNVSVTAGDFDGDGRTDFALLGGDPAWWHTLPVAFSNGDGTFHVTNAPVPDFAPLAAVPNVKVVGGDFDGDGCTDLALVGGDPSWWKSVPVAFSNGDGTFRMTNGPAPQFTPLAAVPGVKTIAGDFDADGRTDLALLGGDPSWWKSLPMVISQGDGTFQFANAPAPSFAPLATVPNAKVIAGDFDADDATDLALVGGDPAWWQTVPLAFSNADGTFHFTNGSSPSFSVWANDPAAKTVSGDFNGDGRADIALFGGYDWWTSPVAFSSGDGSFVVTNAPIH